MHTHGAQKYSSKTTSSPFYWKNGAWVNREEATVSVFDHGLLYGDGCFEGLRFYNGVPFCLDQHIARLERSLRALSIELPFPLSTLHGAVLETIQRSGLNSGYIRLLVTRGEGDLGLNPKNCDQPSVFILPAELSLVSEQERRRGVSLMTSSVRRAVGTGLDTRVKSLNYLHSIMARMEANAAGADEAVLLNQLGFVAECTAENLFIVRGNTLYTPPVQDGALGGITREAILRLAVELSLECREQSLTTYDLYNADECFICGSGARLIPVRSVDGRAYPIVAGTVYETVSKGYEALIEAECGASWSNDNNEVG